MSAAPRNAKKNQNTQSAYRESKLNTVYPIATLSEENEQNEAEQEFIQNNNENPFADPARTAARKQPAKREYALNHKEGRKSLRNALRKGGVTKRKHNSNNNTNINEEVVPQPIINIIEPTEEQQQQQRHQNQQMLHHFRSPQHRARLRRQAEATKRPRHPSRGGKATRGTKAGRGTKAIRGTKTNHKH